jgi:hypothetical protein
VQYHSKRYPPEIATTIREVAAHLDKSSIDASGDYSMHTEYSYAARDLDSELLRRFNSLCTSQRRGIPMLWTSDGWAREFADFLDALVDGGRPPRIVEVHPPFRESVASIDAFLDRYAIFEDTLTERFPSVAIWLENRHGTHLPGGQFLVSNVQDLVDLSRMLDATKLRLDLALDVPQVISGMGGALSMTEERLRKMFSELGRCRHRIRGIHMWGKRRSSRGARAAHVGDLNSYFEGDAELKQTYLECLYDLLNDGRTRYFVPEVNSASDDLVSIVRDMEAAGFKFSGVT